MTSFREDLRECRTRAGLTQKELAEKVDVGIDDSYVSKMEREDFLPSRKVAVGLAHALGMSNKPVTLYVSKMDRAALQRFVFLLKANAAGTEDVEEIRPCEIEVREAEEEDEQESSPTLPTTLHPSLELPESLFDILGGEVEEIKQLIASTRLTDEEEEMVKSALDTTKRLLKFIVAQRKK